jgi:hypothetical protein
MAWDVAVELTDEPGTIASLGEAAAAAGINIMGFCGFPCEGIGVIHMLVDEVHSGADVFESAGLRVKGRREVLVTPVEDRPGALGEMARRFADHGVNIDLLYLANETRVVLGVDDLETARQLV